MTHAPALEFWFEFASTYSYLAASRIEKVAAKAGVTVVWRPFLLGPIFGAQGWNDSPFNIYPAKGRYMWRDMERLTSDLGLPFRHPSRFPRNGLLCARVATLAAVEGWCASFTPAAYRANFGEDAEIGDATVVAAILDSLGRNGRDDCERAQAPRIKDALRASTDQATALGIFGAPTFVVGGEIFWGNDRLEQALDWCVSKAR